MKLSKDGTCRKSVGATTQPVPFSPFLRHATRTGIVLTLLVAAIILLLPQFGSALHAILLPLIPVSLNSFLSGYLYWLTHNRWIGFFEGGLVVASGVLLIFTHNLHQGNQSQHWLAGIEALGGLLNLALVLVPLVVILANTLIWILALIVLFLFMVMVIRIIGELM